ncbi:DNA recombination protein RmuC [Frigoriflavimonas asaccharolytica]|uniref:DNA recombination protein RmuC n=1 Tax=Frigoriflavimonas asaccharolytica TaxID=2735899 RepID=A0A8J8G747_9FLAO|nr:DNA recombination protein RmuC [Frigoriflavimonas asaccharolytica]NRS92728.1 DNA recombination protein RmuC [Frigoriflavimonas asaccharolytica]
MEITYLIIGFLAGGILGATILYFFLKSSMVSRNSFDEINNLNIKTNSNFENSQLKIGELNRFIENEKFIYKEQSIELSTIKNQFSTISASYQSLQDQFIDTKEFIAKQTLKIDELIIENKNIFSTNTELNAINDNLKRTLENEKAEIEKIQKVAKTEFENLANRILEEKTEKFTLQNQTNLKTILDPLQEKINLFEKKVENTHKESIDYHAALRQQIIGLQDLNQQMSKETLNLTKALKGDNKIQGNWGELVLERVLEKSGLEKGREYEVQKSHTNEDGNRVLPDVVINLPDGKKMVIDSKVSLNSYERYINEEEEIQKNIHLKEHVSSIKRHVEQLGNKNYQNLYQMESPDFVLLFIPIEPAFAIALNEDTYLYNKAFEKNIVIVTPSTLLATLRTIDSMWSNQKQQENAFEIARQAGALYDKFDGFVGDLMKIGNKIKDSKSEYDNAMNKLVEGRGNLITSVEKLKKMGAKAKKALPENIIARATSEEEEI